MALLELVHDFGSQLLGKAVEHRLDDRLRAGDQTEAIGRREEETFEIRPSIVRRFKVWGRMESELEEPGSIEAYLAESGCHLASLPTLGKGHLDSQRLYPPGEGSSEGPASVARELVDAGAKLPIEPRGSQVDRKKLARADQPYPLELGPYLKRRLSWGDANNCGRTGWSEQVKDIPDGKREQNEEKPDPSPEPGSWCFLALNSRAVMVHGEP
jgi:hypothetical protein